MNEDTLKFIEWYEDNIYFTGNRYYCIYAYDIDATQLTFDTLKEVYEFYLSLNE